MTRTTTVCVLLLVACADKPRAPATAIDYVDTCAPGRPYKTCSFALAGAHGRGGVFPANDLVDISLLVSNLAEGGAPLAASRTIAFRHLMEFRSGYGTVRARVLELLQRELGPPTNRGIPPVADPMVHAGDFWVVDDGTWILSETAVLWYSAPFFDDGSTWLTRTNTGLRSATVWRRVGHLLVTY